MGGEMWKNNEDLNVNVNVNYTNVVTDPTSSNPTNPTNPYSDQLQSVSGVSFGQLDSNLPTQQLIQSEQQLPRPSRYEPIEANQVSSTMQVDTGFNNPFNSQFRSFETRSISPMVAGLQMQRGLTGQAQLENIPGPSSFSTTGFQYLPNYEESQHAVNITTPSNNQYSSQAYGQDSNISTNFQTMSSNMGPTNFDLPYIDDRNLDSNLTASSQFRNIDPEHTGSSRESVEGRGLICPSYMDHDIRENFGEIRNVNLTSSVPKTEPISINTNVQQQTFCNQLDTLDNYSISNPGSSWDQSMDQQMHSGSSIDSIINVPSQTIHVKKEDVSDHSMYSMMSDEQDDENKVHRRRERNRIAAQRCRQKKRDAAKGLVQQYQELESSNTHLRYEIRQFQKQKNDLERVLSEHLSQCKIKHQFSKDKSKSSNHSHECKKTTTGKPTTIDINQLTPETLQKIQYKEKHENTLFGGDLNVQYPNRRASQPNQTSTITCGSNTVAATATSTLAAAVTKTHTTTTAMDQRFINNFPISTTADISPADLTSTAVSNVIPMPQYLSTPLSSGRNANQGQLDLRSTLRNISQSTHPSEFSARSVSQFPSQYPNQTLRDSTRSLRDNTRSLRDNTRSHIDDTRNSCNIDYSNRHITKDPT